MLINYVSCSKEYLTSLHVQTATMTSHQCRCDIKLRRSCQFYTWVRLADAKADISFASAGVVRSFLYHGDKLFHFNNVINIKLTTAQQDNEKQLTIPYCVQNFIPSWESLNHLKEKGKLYSREYHIGNFSYYFAMFWSMWLQEDIMTNDFHQI